MHEKLTKHVEYRQKTSKLDETCRIPPKNVETCRDLSKLVEAYQNLFIVFTKRQMSVEFAEKSVDFVENCRKHVENRRKHVDEHN